MTLALWRSAYSSVGSVSRMRVSSVMAPSFSGTLKSTRMSTRLSASSRSRMESFGIHTEYVVLPPMGTRGCKRALFATRGALLAGEFTSAK